MITLTLLRRHLSGGSERGQTMAEYALIMALVVIVGLSAWALLGTNITAAINQIAACV